MIEVYTPTSVRVDTFVTGPTFNEQFNRRPLGMWKHTRHTSRSQLKAFKRRWVARDELSKRA